MPKRIKFEGSTHVFPDDFTDDDISGALGSLHPKPALSPVPGAAMTGTPKAGSAPAVDMNVWNPVRGMVPSSKMEPKPLPPSSWGNFKDTVASDITGIPKGMYNTVAHPIDTAKALLTPPKEGEGQMPFSEIAGHAVSTGLVAGAGRALPAVAKAVKPVVGPAARVMAGAVKGAVEETPILGKIAKGAVKGGREAIEGVKARRVADAEAALLDKYNQEPPDWMESPPKPPSMFERYGDPEKAGVLSPEAPVAPPIERPLPAWASMEPPKMESAPAVEPVPATESIGSGRKPGNAAHGEEVARKHAEAEAARAAAEPSPESWFVDSPPPKPPTYPESVGPPVAPGPPLAPPVEPKVTPPLPPPPPKAGLADPGALKVQPPPEPPVIKPPDRSSVPPLSVERTSPIPIPPPEVTTAPPVPVTVKSGPPAPLQIGRPVPKVQEPPRAPADVVPETTVIGAPAVPDAPVPVPAPDMHVPPAGASEAPVPPARELPSGHRAVPEGDAVLEGVHPDYAELPSPRKAQAKDLRVAEGLAKQGVTVDKLARALDEGDWAKINRWVKSVHPEHRAYDPLKLGSDPAALEARVQKLVNTYRRMPAVAAEAPVVEPVVDAPPPVVEEAPAVTVPKAGRKIGSGKRKKAATSAE